MNGQDHFRSDQLAQIPQALRVAEDATGDHFALTAFDASTCLYDIRTMAELADHERDEGVLAQVLKYGLSTLPVDLNPGGRLSFYRICLQDPCILEFMERRGVGLHNALVYILTHELVHIVRFAKFQSFYDLQEGLREREEGEVDQITHQILRRIRRPDLQGLLDQLDRSKRPGSNFAISEWPRH